MKLFITMLLSIIGTSIFAQQNSDELIQFSGLVLNKDSTRGMPLVSIKIRNTNKGTYSDQTGFFSFVARKGSTIIFSSIGLKTVQYKIPDQIESPKFSVIITMHDDTLLLPETYVHPYPTPEEFNYYFVKANIPDIPYEVARGNLRRQVLSNMSHGMTYDSREAQRYSIQEQDARYYYNGQLAPTRIFDPFAWGQFFRAVKSGAYNSLNAGDQK